ncbi:hypothetical protein [Ornithinimicrobium sufpigmenti]|uniref:baeRF11 domain-containing protein n=1 Tax=Ornithinimicrobium sufpigmenti TaxID=2508882 RepID=UPI00192D2A3B|nr:MULTISPECIES: hypothetical protein [unclassified Ornithinimicrobium]
MPTRSDIERLAAARDPLSLSIYLPTSTPPDAEHDRLQARALVDEALATVREHADKRTAAQVEENLRDLLDDTGFFRELGRSLAIFATPTRTTSYRLPNLLSAEATVGDRFTITPLLRAVTFPQAAYVLALSQNRARLVRVNADGPATEVRVPGMPADAASRLGVDNLARSAPGGRRQGDEGIKVRLTQYAREVDRTLRPVLRGDSLPLILAAAEPLASIFRNLTGYGELAPEGIDGNPDTLSEAELADAARGILDRTYAAELAGLHETFGDRQANGRATNDLADLARAVTIGAVATLLVDMDAHVEGRISEDGTLTLGESDQDVLEEIAARAIGTGARVLAVRTDDLPGQAQAAGILRYAP